ncbi:DEAD/DEAH box helicase [Undibacterium sp. SXout7W]|uniref:DEAD/DEAH box helicase n=1 Tax=Undibacterium sp. SXout7W TaxID=3413049 RepID=UPI003BF424AE
MSLQTLHRGDGLLGMRPSGDFGPRGGQVTVVQIDWLYQAGEQLHWEVPAPTTLLNRRPHATHTLFDAQHQPYTILRDLDAEADALDLVWEAGLHPLPADTLQWRSEQMPDSIAHGPLWSLLQEDFFSDFWADQCPRLQEQGWLIQVRPGFAHESVTVDAWHLILDPVSGDIAGKTVAATMRSRSPGITALGLPAREGSWMLSLGVEIEGETLDLVPMLAHLLKHDRRWLDAKKLMQIDDAATIRLRAPGGRRIDAPAAPLKAIVSHLLDMLTDSRQPTGPLPLAGWDQERLESLRMSLSQSESESQASRAGAHGAWQLQGQAGLQALSTRLQQSGGVQAIPSPEGLGITLRPYQLHGVAWLQYLREQHLAGILADDMGLGKTAQVLAHILTEKLAGRLQQPALIIVPSSLLFNWQAEAQRMTPQLRVLSLQGPERSTLFATIPHVDIVMTSYPLLWRDLDILRRQSFHLLVLDEAQTVKNATSRSAGAVRRIQARHRLCVTGTPLENNLAELWTQFDFLMPGFLGDSRSFQRQWRKPIEVNGETSRADLLAKRVRPFILRRRKDEVASELPLKTVAIKKITLQGKQRDLYESVRVAADEQIRRLIRQKGFAGSHISILDALLKLRQVCCDPRLLHSINNGKVNDIECAKMELLIGMLPSLIAEGRRILIFSQFTTMLELIASELETLDLPYLTLTGNTPVHQRSEVVERFQNKEKAIMLISLKAGGVGLNLTAADTVIHMDPWWNPAVEEQANARAHRIGQLKPVFIYHLIVQGSIEEKILELQSRKARLAEGILGSDTAFAEKFNQQDLQDLLSPLQTNTGSEIGSSE